MTLSAETRSRRKVTAGFVFLRYARAMSIEPSPDLSLSLPPDPSREVPEAVTPLSERDIATALDVGHVLAFGVSASPARLSVAWAMICEETARGKAIHCFNFGNVDASEEWTGPIFRLVAPEGSGTRAHLVGKWLRAYPDANSGAMGWWQFMAAHYSGALVAFDSGDGNAAEARLTGYATGNRAEYAAALVSLSREFVRRRASGSL